VSGFCVIAGKRGICSLKKFKVSKGDVIDLEPGLELGPRVSEVCKPRLAISNIAYAH
jgi:hypothetical protein